MEGIKQIITKTKIILSSPDREKLEAICQEQGLDTNRIKKRTHNYHLIIKNKKRRTKQCNHDL